MPTVDITVMAQASRTTQLLNPIIRHVILLDGETVFEQLTQLREDTSGVGISVRLDNIPAGIHKIEYFNEDTRPWSAAIIVDWRKPNGRFTNPRIVAIGVAYATATLTAQTFIGGNNITPTEVKLAQTYWQPGDLIQGTCTLTNDGETNGILRLTVRILGTAISASTRWLELNVGQTTTIDLSTLGLQVPHWLTINWDELLARGIEYFPSFFLELTIETQEAVGYTHCAVWEQLDYTLQPEISVWSYFSEGTVPVTIPVAFRLSYVEYDKTGTLVGAGYIANASLDAYLNDEYFPPPAGVQRVTDSNGKYVEKITFTVADKYVVVGYFKGTVQFPPAFIREVCVFIANPAVGVIAEIVPDSVTLPCNQKLDPGTKITGTVAIHNRGDTTGYCALQVCTYEYATGTMTCYIGGLKQLAPCQSTTVDIATLGITMPQKGQLDILLTPGKVEDPTNPADTFTAAGGVICTIYPTLGAKGHLETYKLPSSLQTGQPITGTITVKNVGGMRGKIALKVTTLWDNKLVFAGSMELDPEIEWVVDVSQLGIYMPNQNATIRMEAGHLEDGMETFVLDEPPTEHTITLTAPPPPGYATLYGYVKDAWTTKPIPNATVKLNGTSTTTDSTGWFSLTVPAKAEPYTLTVTASGYSPYTESITLSEATPYRKDVNLTPTTALLKGTARNIRTGAGVPDVTITLNTKYSAKTDSYGRYQIEKITVPATLTLTATRTGFQTFTYTLNFPTADIYTFDFDMTPTPPPPVEYATLKGTVRSPFGMVSGAAITLNGIETASNPDGTYTIEGITLGTYTLTVKPPWPLSLICKAHVETLDLTEAKEYTKDIYLPINIINVTAITAGIGLLATLSIYAVRE
jgi:hypothetical protein